tara:strand:+ start:160 stop:1587 length:1428 start_codon:yes stop_codon:yes gene_type:complete
MSCLNCHGPVEPNQRTGKPKKYCSRKCANQWHHSRAPSVAVPEGYLTSRQAASYLNYTFNTWNSMQFRGTGDGHVQFGRPKSILWQETHGNKITRKLYKKEDLDSWYQELLDFRKERRELNAKIRENRKAKKQALAQALKQQRQEEYNQKIKGMLTIPELAKQTKANAGVISKLREDNIITGVHIKKSENQKGQWFFDAKTTPDIIRNHYFETRTCASDICTKQFTVAKGNLQKTCSTKCSNNALVFHRDDDWTSPENYEANATKRKLPKYASNPKKAATVKKATKINEQYAAQAAAGNVTVLSCSKCFTSKAYTEFYKDLTYTRGRRNSCKTCDKARSRKHPNYLKRGWSSPAAKLRHNFGCGIKNGLSKRNQQYAKKISIPDVWDALLEHCGYDEHMLAKHIEEQFDENMNWENHGRHAADGKYRWNIDHITERSKFVYTSFADPQFAECWSLSNLRPLEAKENIGRNRNAKK